MECAVPLQREINKTAKIWHIYMNIVARRATNIIMTTKVTIITIITTTRPMSLTNIIMTTKVMTIIITSTP